MCRYQVDDPRDWKGIGFYTVKPDIRDLKDFVPYYWCID